MDTVLVFIGLTFLAFVWLVMDCIKVEVKELEEKQKMLLK